MIVLIFVLGVLLGVVAGGGTYIRYLRREMSADLGPQLRRIQLQLDNLEMAVNLAVMTRYVEVSAASRPAATILQGPTLHQ